MAILINRPHLAIAAAAVGALGTLLVTTPAHASLIADGITYTLTETTTGDPLTDQFVLTITGINGASDAEGGRSGVNAIAFNKPTNFSSAVMIAPPLAYTYEAGGLNSSGCNGSGNFYCFDANTTPPTTPALAADSTLNFTFDVTLSSGNFAGYAPDFKIDWIGTKNNYDLVSKELDPTPGTPPPVLPEPGSLALLGTALAGLGIAWRRRKAA